MHTKIFHSLLLALLLAFNATSWAVEQTITVPGEGWHIRFDAPQLAPAAGMVPSVFYGAADRFQLSIFVEPPRCGGPDTSENIYDCFLQKMLKNPYIMRDSIRANTTQNGVLVMAFSKIESEGRVGTNFSMHLLFARKGKWADVHASFASPTKEDVKALLAIMESIKIEDDSVASSPNGSK